MARALPFLTLALMACPSSEPEDTVDLGTDREVTGTRCFQTAPAADRERFLVVSHPFAAPGVNDNRFEVFSVDTAGTPSPTGIEFRMGSASSRRIQFSPNGELGIAVQNDGTLGVFRIDSTGAVTVIHDAYGSGQFYASDVVFDLGNEQLTVVDENFRNNGGGLYTVAVDCETGTLSSPSQATPGKRALAFLPRDGFADVVVAVDVANSAEGNDIHLLDDVSGEVVAGVSLLSEEAIVSSAAIVGEEWVLVGDGCGFCTAPNSVAIAQLNDNTLTATTVLSPLEDPFDIVASPFGNAAIVSSGFGDELLHLTLNGDTWTNAGQIVRLPLPGAMDVVRRGTLRGHVYAAENTGIRHVAFAEDGNVADLGVTALGDSIPNIVGTLGIQP
jgi:hypothetical protein